MELEGRTSSPWSYWDWPAGVVFPPTNIEPSTLRTTLEAAALILPGCTATKIVATAESHLLHPLLLTAMRTLLSLHGVCGSRLNTPSALLILLLGRRNTEVVVHSFAFCKGVSDAKYNLVCCESVFDLTGVYVFEGRMLIRPLTK